MALGEQPQPQVLHQVGVLVFVHQDVAEPAVIIGQDVRLGPQDLRHVQHQVAEIRRVQRPQPLLIGGVQRLGAAVGEIGVLVRGDPRRGQAAVLPALDHPHQRRRHPALGVDPFGLHHLLQQAKLVVGVQDGEVGRQPDMLRVAAQHAGAQGVEGAEPEALGRFAEDGGDAFAHLARGLVGEGDGQDLVGEGALGQQDVREAGGQDAGLAGAGTGQHQQRAIDGFDRRALFGVEAGQVVRGKGDWARHPGDIGQLGAGKPGPIGCGDRGRGARRAQAQRRACLVPRSNANSGARGRRCRLGSVRGDVGINSAFLRRPSPPRTRRHTSKEAAVTSALAPGRGRRGRRRWQPP